MSFTAHTAKDRRLVILRLLAEAPSYTTNDSILDDMLSNWGHKVSRDTVRGDLVWLEEQGMLRLEIITSVHIATLLARGLDVSKGEASHPGIKKPRPGE